MGNCIETTNFQDINKSGFSILNLIPQRDDTNIIFNPISLYLSFASLAENLENDSFIELKNLFKYGENDVISDETLKKLTSYFKDEEIQLKKMTFFVFEKTIKIKNTFKACLTKKYNFYCEEIDMKDNLKQDHRKIEGFSKAKGYDFTIKNQYKNFFILNYTKFNLRWKEGFNEHKNYKGKFTCTDEIEVTCEYMKGGKNCGFLKDNHQIYLSIPSNKEGILFVISFNEQNGHLDPLIEVKIDKVFQSTMKPPVKVKVCLPKFECFSSIGVKIPMLNLNVKKIFEQFDEKDFKFISEKNILLDELHQSSTMSFKEEGEIGENLNKICKMKVVINRPFSFFLVDSVNQLIILSGILRYPDEENDF